MGRTAAEEAIPLASGCYEIFNLFPIPDSDRNLNVAKQKLRRLLAFQFKCGLKNKQRHSFGDLVRKRETEERGRPRSLQVIDLTRWQSATRNSFQLSSSLGALHWNLLSSVEFELIIGGNYLTVYFLLVVLNEYL